MDHRDEQKHHDSEQQAGPACSILAAVLNDAAINAQPTEYTENKHGVYTEPYVYHESCPEENSLTHRQKSAIWDNDHRNK
jgi:hypothetical protein